MMVTKLHFFIVFSSSPKNYTFYDHTFSCLKYAYNSDYEINKIIFQTAETLKQKKTSMAIIGFQVLIKSISDI